MASRSCSMLLLLALGGAGLTGCLKGSPTGTVLATVDGEEITSWQLQAEARATGIRLNGPDAVKNRGLLLDRIITRQALINAAKKEGLDRKPEIAAEQQRQGQLYLANTFLASRASSSDPSRSEVDAFVAKNQALFAQRQKLHVRQIRFEDMKLSDRLTKSKTLEEVTAYLDAINVNYEQDDPVLDSALLPPDLTTALLKLKNGEPLFFSSGGYVYFTSLINHEPYTAPAESQRSLARQLLMGQDRKTETGAIVGQARAASKIAYQAGYAPKEARSEKAK